MKILRWLAILVMLSILIPPTVVLAGTSVGVTVTATPLITSGITNFTITYISDTQLDLDWGFAPTAVNIMIRAKYGEYPADIPNMLTAPTDGYFVYYGNGVSVSDTSMDFDQNPGLLYYKAWARRADGTWFVHTSTGSEESRAMALLALLGFAGICSVLALWKKSPLLGVVASAGWIIILIYTRSNPVGGMTIGDTADSALVMGLAAAIIAIPLASWQLGRSGKVGSTSEIEGRETSSDREIRGNRDDTIRSSGTQRNTNISMSASEYKAKIHGRLYPNSRRR